ncbi:MAG: NTP transferase domain-containing protein [Oscillospiraceae bacterium]|nr:NTP transferase domain-containing protein [Oscillospiraceae bacterium]
MRISKVGGVIAAASKKVAQPLLRVGTISVIRRIVITYQQAGIFPIVIITGAEEEEVKRQLASYGVIFVRNGEPDEPELFTSVRLGLEYLDESCDRVMFTPVNVPMFTPTTLLTMMEREGDVVIASYQGRGGHPVLISHKAIPAILGYKGSEGLRGAIASGGLRRAWADVDDKGVLLNVHNVEELEAQLEEHNAAILHPVLHMRMERESPFLNERLKLLLFLLSNNYSIRKGCACTGLAYSKAWEMINQLEHNLGYLVVERQRGGRGGGGTSLTPEGERFLLAYQEFEETVHQIAQKEFRERFIYTKIIQ